MANPWDNDEIVKPASAASAAAMPWANDPIVPSDKSRFMQSQVEPRENTTLLGLQGAVARGVSPYVMGAGIGAAAGAPFAGVGAVPGAIAGAGAVALSDLAGAAYNPVAQRMGWPHLSTGTEVANKLMDMIGTTRAETPTERIVQSATQNAAAAFTGTGMAKQAAERFTSPLARSVANVLAERPGMQTTSGFFSGAAGQAAAEAGYGPVGQLAASLFGGFLPFTPRAIGRSVAAEPTPAAREARDAGYVLPPSAASDEPRAVSNVLSAWGGKTKTQQAASIRNQEVTNQLAARSLGLPTDTTLTEATFEQVRNQAGRAYSAISNSVPEMAADTAFKDGVKLLSSTGKSGDHVAAAEHFGEMPRNPDIEALQAQLDNVSKFPPAAAVQRVRELRAEASRNARAATDPQRQALASAQRRAADLIDDLMERNLSAAGKGDLVPQYREARQRIARSYDVEAATNTATGDVSARKIGNLDNRGRPLTGDLKTVANAANAFPKAMQSPSVFGGPEAHSVLDVFGTVMALAHGHPGIAASIVGRPLVRNALLSERYQNAMMGPRGAPAEFPLANLMATRGLPTAPQQDQSANSMLRLLPAQ